MPTAAKLICAILFAGFGYLFGGGILEMFPDQFTWKYLNLFLAVVGLFLGWRLVGKQAERSLAGGVSSGVTATVLMLVVTVAATAFATMIDRATGRRYHGLMAGLEDMMAVMADRFWVLTRLDVALLICIVGIVFGAIGYLVARSWR